MFEIDLNLSQVIENLENKGYKAFSVSKLMSQIPPKTAKIPPCCFKDQTTLTEEDQKKYLSDKEREMLEKCLKPLYLKRIAKLDDQYGDEQIKIGIMFARGLAITRKMMSDQLGEDIHIYD